MPPARFAVATVSPPGYAHCAAFREVAETLHHGLRALGHDSILTDDTVPRGRRPIVLGSNLLPSTRQRLSAEAILYNLEQLDPGSPWLVPELLDLFRTHEVWDYSDRNAAQYPSLGLPPPRVVPIGYVPHLTRIAPQEEDIDVLFYGSINGRRRRILDALRERGLRVEEAFGVYGVERDRLIARSRLVLNVHYYEAKVFEIVRVSYLLANRRCVVSERGVDDLDERLLARGVAFAAYDELVDACARLVADPPERARIAAEGFALVSARDEVPILRSALEGRASSSGTRGSAAVVPPPSYYGHARPEIVALARPKGCRVLDVGCAAGAMGAAMQAAGAAEVVGIEITSGPPPPPARGFERSTGWTWRRYPPCPTPTDTSSSSPSPTSSSTCAIRGRCCGTCDAGFPARGASSAPSRTCGTSRCCCRSWPRGSGTTSRRACSTGPTSGSSLRSRRGGCWRRAGSWSRTPCTRS